MEKERKISSDFDLVSLELIYSDLNDPTDVG